MADINNQRNSSKLPLKEWQKVLLSETNSEHGIECLLNIWNNHSFRELVKDTFCDGLWDGAYCWPPSKSGTVLTRLCSEVLQNEYPDYASKLTGKVTRVCLENGTWTPESTEVYTECIKSLELYIQQSKDDEIITSILSYTLFYGSLLSLVCLSASLTIFYHYGCLRNDRVRVQIQLILSLLLRSILMFVIAEPLVLGHQSSYRDVDILCEAVLVLFLYATFVSVTWMFLQGLYLNLSFMSPATYANIDKNLRLYYIFGWVVPAGFVLIYVIAMLLKDQQRCWQGYSEMNEIWILFGPTILGLSANVLFLLNVLRIVVRKIRNSSTRPDASQIKAAAKAAAILFPVLGINNLIFYYNPGGEYYKIFMMMNTFCGSTQGIFVAIVYCFANKDVRAAIQRSIQRANARRMDDRSDVQCMVLLNIPRS